MVILKLCYATDFASEMEMFTFSLKIRSIQIRKQGHVYLSVKSKQNCTQQNGHMLQIIIYQNSPISPKYVIT